MLNGVIRTDEWLEEDFQAPDKICERLLSSFGETSSRSLYEYLMSFGMYKPNRGSWINFQKMKEIDIWNKVASLLKRYQKAWNGPDISIYIFPLYGRSLFQHREGPNKSGVSFHDKMFLFLAPFEDERELEALFVHEYHHVCRMKQQKKDVKDYTLLDSFILEGTAEYTVEQLYGIKFRAKWCSYYSDEELDYYWRTIKKHLTIKRNRRLHDQILFGIGEYPRLIGYALGYDLVRKYFSQVPFNQQTTFTLPAESFIEAFDD